VQLFIFKLEEVNAALLLHLPALFVETTFFSSATDLGLLLVVEIPQVPAKLTLQVFCCFAATPYPL
jgi:hypothetical protein